MGLPLNVGFPHEAYGELVVRSSGQLGWRDARLTERHRRCAGAPDVPNAAARLRGHGHHAGHACAGAGQPWVCWRTRAQAAVRTASRGVRVCAGSQEPLALPDPRVCGRHCRPRHGHGTGAGTPRARLPAGRLMLSPSERRRSHRRVARVRRAGRTPAGGASHGPLLIGKPARPRAPPGPLSVAGCACNLSKTCIHARAKARVSAFTSL